MKNVFILSFISLDRNSFPILVLKPIFLHGLTLLLLCLKFEGAFFLTIVPEAFEQIKAVVIPLKQLFSRTMHFSVELLAASNFSVEFYR